MLDLINQQELNWLGATMLGTLGSGPDISSQGVDDVRVTDETLFARASTGSEGAAEVLYRRYAGPLYGFFYKRVRDHELAEDLASETISRVFLNSASFTSGSFSGWLYTIGRHILADHWRRTQPLLPLDETVGTPPGWVDVWGERELALDHAICWEVLDSFDELSPTAHRIMWLRIIGYRPPEIATMLGMEISAIQSHLYRARRRLREIIPRNSSQPIATTFHPPKPGAGTTNVHTTDRRMSANDDIRGTTIQTTKVA